MNLNKVFSSNKLELRILKRGKIRKQRSPKNKKKKRLMENNCEGNSMFQENMKK